MNLDTIITILVSVLSSGITAFAVISFRMGRYSEKIDQLEKCNLNTRLSTLEGKFENNQPLTKRRSPISLSERGTKVLTDSTGMKFVDDNYSELKTTVENKRPKTAYDVQEFSKEIIDGLKNDARINSIKEYAFKEGLELDDIVVVIGIYLRDKILKDKNWNVEDIDKYLPKS